MKDTKRYWFGPKRMGFGVSPSSWQGWLVLAVYVVLVALLAQLLPASTHPVGFWGSLAGMTVVLAAVAVVTYGPRDSR